MAWHGLLAVSALTGKCFSLAQVGMAHTLLWLSCMPAGDAAWPCLACHQIWLTQTLTSAAALPGLVCPLSPGSFAPLWELQASKGVLKVPLPDLLPAPESMCALLGMICPQS